MRELPGLGLASGGGRSRLVSWHAAAGKAQTGGVPVPAHTCTGRGRPAPHRARTELSEHPAPGSAALACPGSIAPAPLRPLAYSRSPSRSPDSWPPACSHWPARRAPQRPSAPAGGRSPGRGGSSSGWPPGCGVTLLPPPARDSLRGARAEAPSGTGAARRSGDGSGSAALSRGRCVPPGSRKGNTQLQPGPGSLARRIPSASPELPAAGRERGQQAAGVGGTGTGGPPFSSTPAGMEPPAACLWLSVLSCLLAWVSSTHPECIIMLAIEHEHEKCLADSGLDNQTVGCARMWDNITCWPSAAVGEVVVIPCPTYFIFFSSSLGNVTRNCTSQGWADMYPAPYAAACGYDTNSTPIEETTFYGTVKTGYTIGHSLSLIALTAAMIILCLFRKLHCTRNYIHMHLFMSFIMRAIAVFIKDVILFESGESDHCSTSSVGCKAAMVFFQYCIMANFFWLLVEGLYLHTLLVVSFFSERKYFWWYILIGWGAPSVFITAWTLIKVHYENIGCWEDIGESQYWLIIRAPIAVSILVNFILFICIIRILFQKLHSPDVGRNETSQYSRLAKSTLLLIPLFGVHYIVFAFFPDNFKMEIKLVFELVLGSFQGFVGAVLYCFLNGEVQAELKRKWRRWHLERFLGSDMKYHHPSVGSNGTNFSTQISMLTKCSPKTRRCSSSQADFSLV